LAYLAAESGSAEGAGDFFWGTQITGLVLLVAAVTFWVRRGVGPTWRTAAVGAAAALQVGCGIFWWATQLGPSPTGWW
ncbi:MAG TPA: hypothetical protein VFO60_02030, partial [Candidatus Dormibacteraeota bacterium]|nr:hypothetical protein [Candidatus Dormibacteraeota bacterium]